MTPFRTALTTDPQDTDHRCTDKQTLLLAKRFRRTAAEADLAAPEVFDPKVYPNPNWVAAYFDNPEPSSSNERYYEEECQKSDSLMAEAFCCSEILRIWQEQPVRAPRSCRMRLYAIEDNVRDPESDADLLPMNPPENRSYEPATDPYPFLYDDIEDEKPVKESENSSVQVHSTVSRIRKGIEALLLTLLIFGLLIWLIPIARSRFAVPPVQTVESESLPAESSDTPAESALPAAEPVEKPVPAPSYSPERLSLNGLESDRPSVLTIPTQNNDVFRR